MSGIGGHCFTNLDEFARAEWPQQFCGMPRVGEYVEGWQGESGPGSRPRLRIIAITHYYDRQKRTPMLRVELHR